MMCGHYSWFKTAWKNWSPPQLKNTLLQIYAGGQYPTFQLNPVFDPNETVRRFIAVPGLIEKKRLYPSLL
jgi:hypothetical protein